MVESDAGEPASWATNPLFCAHAGWKHRRSPDETVASRRKAIETPDPLLTRLMAIPDKEPAGSVDLYGDARYLVDGPFWRVLIGLVGQPLWHGVLPLSIQRSGGGVAARVD